MMSKEDLVVALLHKQLSEIKVGIIVKGCLLYTSKYLSNPMV